MFPKRTIPSTHAELRGQKKEKFESTTVLFLLSLLLRCLA